MSRLSLFLRILVTYVVKASGTETLEVLIILWGRWSER